MLAPRRAVGGACALVFLLLCLVAFTADVEWYRISLRSSSNVVIDNELCTELLHMNITPQGLDDRPLLIEGTVKRKHVAIASVFGFHFDVYMALAWTMERVLAKVPDSELQVFAHSFYYGFQSVVDSLGLHHGPRNDIEDFIPYLRNNPTLDLVVLGTCEVDLREMHSELLAEWDTRSDHQKFQLVCIAHNIADTAWQDHIADWSRRGAIRLLPLGEHVKGAFRTKFDALADSTEPLLYTAAYEHIPIDVHIPVLDVPNLPEKDPRRTLAKAVIQGSFDTSRRDYYRFFDEMIQSLHEDPRGWGYHALDDRVSFIPDYRADVPPFELALVGSGSLEIPIELAYMVSIYRGLDYLDFYKLIAGMDIVVPAFADNGYYENQASSTVALAVELNVPILATRRMRKAYKYIDDDRTVVTRPSAMREVQALKLLRSGNSSQFLEREQASHGISLLPINELVVATHAMVDRGWTRSAADVKEYKAALWRHNELVVQQLLRDGVSTQ